MSNQIEQLLQMKETLLENKTLATKIKGKIETLTDSIKKDFGCNNMTEAQKKLNEMTDELEKNQLKLKNGIELLEKRYPALVI